MAVLLIFALFWILLLALIIWRAWRGFANRNLPMSLDATLPGSQQEVADQLRLAVAPLLEEWRYRLSTQTQTSFVYSCTYRPIWLAIPVLLFFPIGLLALLYRRTVDLSFATATAGSAANLSIVGKCPSYVRDQLRDLVAGLEKMPEEGLEPPTRGL